MALGDPLLTSAICHLQIPAHRATCPICLCDFEEVIDQPSSSIHVEETEADGRTISPEIKQVEPLRLLKCGHVMHKSCVDKWMLEISGRCPVCQAAVKSSPSSSSSTTTGPGANQG